MFGDLFGISALGLHYEAQLAGIDGECFQYSVYFEGAPDEEAVSAAICAWLQPYEAQEIYMGYLSITKEDDKVCIYLDLGNVAPEHQNPAIQGILKALDGVAGIRSVIINEDCGFDF